MKKLILLLCLYLILLSCSNTNKEKASITEPEKLTEDSIKLTSEKEKDKEKKKADKPDIIPLPFGPEINSLDDFYEGNYNNSFYDDLIGYSIYELPEIEKFEYIQFGWEKYSNRGNFIDSLFKISKYKYRLPDIGNCQVYYMCDISFGYITIQRFLYGEDTDSTIYKLIQKSHLPFEFITNCPGYIYNKYGYLIIYNKNNKNAKTIPVFFETFSESNHLREFYIDENYKINIIHINIYEDVDDNGMPRAGVSRYNIFTINILENGELDILEKDYEYNFSINPIK